MRLESNSKRQIDRMNAGLSESNVIRNFINGGIQKADSDTKKEYFPKVSEKNEQLEHNLKKQENSLSEWREKNIPFSNHSYNLRQTVDTERLRNDLNSPTERFTGINSRKTISELTYQSPKKYNFN